MLNGIEYNRKADHMETALRGMVEDGRYQEKTLAHILLTMAQGTSDADDGCAKAQRAFVADLDQRTFHEPELKKIIGLARDVQKADERATKQREAEQRKEEMRLEGIRQIDQRLEEKRREEQRCENQRRDELRREEQRREEREEQRRTQRLVEEREQQQARSHHYGFHESGGSANGRELFQGPRGGVYHMSSGGNRVYQK